MGSQVDDKCRMQTGGGASMRTHSWPPTVKRSLAMGSPSPMPLTRLYPIIVCSCSPARTSPRLSHSQRRVHHFIIFLTSSQSSHSAVNMPPQNAAYTEHCPKLLQSRHC